MKKHIAAIFLVAFCLDIDAQDQLFKNDNTRLQVKILEVGPEEIRYKLHSNLNGPTYVESRSNVSLIVYESGQHEVFTRPAGQPQPAESGPPRPYVAPGMTPADSLLYYKYIWNISMNFFPLLNNEVGLLLQREVFDRQFCVVIPLAVGLERPSVTNNVYFSHRVNNSTFEPDRKIFEVGAGVNYYPSLRSNTNYYIGPVFRYIQYEGVHSYWQSVGGGLGQYYTKSTYLSRYCFSITNGAIVRTRSRLTINFYASLGFKYDELADPLLDAAGQKVNTIPNPVSLYIWTGFNLGFNF
jgi:hypothetical protein